MSSQAAKVPAGKRRLYRLFGVTPRKIRKDKRYNSVKARRNSPKVDHRTVEREIIRIAYISQLYFMLGSAYDVRKNIAATVNVAMQKAEKMMLRML